MFTVRARHVLFVSLIVVLVVPALAAAPLAEAQEGPPQVGLHPFAEGYALHGPNWVGTREFTIDPDSDRPIPLLVWYPALNPEGAEESVTYEYQAKWIPGPDFTPVVYGHALGDAAPDAAAAPYPVLVFSPGFGTSPASYTNLLEHAASYGFVVLAPDHLEHVYLMEENLFKDLPISTVENPRDITRVLDYAEGLTASGGALEGMIDLERVAVAGHSSGGQTALAAGGARLDLTAFNTRCESARAQGDPNACLCDPLEPFEADIAAAAGLDPIPEGLWPSWGDPRVDAIISMAGDSYLFGEAGLAEITVPLLAMGGTADTGTPAEWGILPAFEYASSQQKALVLFENAEHGIVANSCASSPWLVDIGLGWQCASPIWDRLRGNDLVNYLMTAFLLDVLKGDSEAHAALAPDAVQFPGTIYEAQGF
jgi:predicted dienelactone hydrolase